MPCDTEPVASSSSSGKFSASSYCGEGSEDGQLSWKASISYQSVMRIIRDAIFNPACLLADRDMSFVLLLASLHGLCSNHQTLPSLQHEMLRHLFLGQCFTSSASHCQVVAAQHNSDPKPFIVLLLDEALVSDLSTNHSISLCRSLGLSDVQLANTRSKKETNCLIRLRILSCRSVLCL